MRLLQTLLRKTVYTGMMLLLSGFAAAEEDVLDYFFDELVFNDESSQHQYEQIQTLLRNGQFEPAKQSAEELVDNNVALTETNPILYGKLLANLGILLSSQGHYLEAMEALDPGLEFIEQKANPFSTTLMNVIMARGLTQSELDNFEDAEESFRRAQHISHRVGGVYTPEQLEIINYITMLNLRQGKVFDADREQEFNLRISEQAYGKDSEELLPILRRLGSYFASRGQMIPLTDAPEFRYYRDSLFRQSISLFERAIKIIEDNYGTNDLRLVEPLRGLARSRLLQITNRSASEAALERALAIVDSNPDTDVPDRVRALIGLGDMYTITGDRRARKTYLKAWDLMQEDPTYRQLSAELFGTPTRLHPEVSGVLYLNRKPDAALVKDVELYIDVAYSVRANGRVTNIHLIEKNVPNAQVRYMRSRLAETRFRPRILDGELVATDNLMIHQTFEVIGSGPIDPHVSIEQYGKNSLLPNNKLPQLTR
jgi:tetratricopeptide (TPR) repeat protein